LGLYVLNVVAKLCSTSKAEYVQKILCTTSYMHQTAPAGFSVAFQKKEKKTTNECHKIKAQPRRRLVQRTVMVFGQKGGGFSARGLQVVAATHTKAHTDTNPTPQRPSQSQATCCTSDAHSWPHTSFGVHFIKGHRRQTK